MNIETINKKDFAYHHVARDELFKDYNTTVDGLSETVAIERQRFFGFNLLKESDKKSIWVKLFEQFKNIMVVILLAAALISFVLHEYADAFIIFAVVILNAVLGVMQESKAEKALDALKEMSSPYSKVKRNGVITKIKSQDIVPGDIVLLEAGDNIPADIRLMNSASLKIEESSLTGESVPSEK